MFSTRHCVAAQENRRGLDSRFLVSLRTRSSAGTYSPARRRLNLVFCHGLVIIVLASALQWGISFFLGAAVWLWLVFFCLLFIGCYDKASGHGVSFFCERAALAS
jgi:hypothetical protein